MILFLIFSKICSLLPSSLSITTPNTKSQIPKPPKFPNRKRTHITKIIIHKRIQNKQINRVRIFLRLSSSRGGRALQVRTHRSFLSRPFHLFTSSKETKKPKKKKPSSSRQSEEEEEGFGAASQYGARLTNRSTDLNRSSLAIS